MSFTAFASTMGQSGFADTDGCEFQSRFHRELAGLVPLVAPHSGLLLAATQAWIRIRTKP